MRKSIASLLLGGLLIASAGCQIEELVPDRVAAGASRLSVRNAGVLTKLLNEDTQCGFSSPEVLDSFVTEGEIGKIGVLTYVVENCELNFGDSAKVVAKDCTGVETSVLGKVTVSATRTVEGILTGKQDNPVIPAGPRAATIDVIASFDNYWVGSSAADNAITLVSGKMKFQAIPPLAVSKSLGVCSVATSNLSLPKIQMENVIAVVDSGDSDFNLEIPTADFEAQVGKWGKTENYLGGSMTVWKSLQHVPLAKEENQLDPDYDAKKFTKSYSCSEDLQTPISYQCESLTPQLAQGAASLTVATLGRLAALADERCFSEQDVIDNVQLTGELGRVGAARYELTTPCEIELLADTPVSEDCNGKTTFLEGKIRVTGSKTLTGYRSGDIEQPIVPNSAQPATIELAVEFNDETGFELTDSESLNRIRFRSGALSGTMSPRTGIDETLGACTISTPVATFQNVRLTDADVEVGKDGMSFNLQIDNALLNAQNGKNGATENHMEGQMVVNGEEFLIPVNGNAVLDPNYDPATFLSTFLCTENLKIAGSDQECSFNRVLGENAARLLVMSSRIIGSAVNTDKDCGFARLLDQMQPTTVEGKKGEIGFMSWDIEECEIDFEETSELKSDCAGERTYGGGLTSTTATRNVTGEREKIYVVVDSIIPRTRDAVEVELHEIKLTDWEAYQIAPDAEEATGIISIPNASLSGTLIPVLGERESEPGVFDITTLVSVVKNLSITPSEVTISAQGKTFVLDIDGMNIDALVGRYQGQGNFLRGSINVNGEEILIENAVLNPSFDQELFDSQYVCEEDLLEVIPPN